MSYLLFVELLSVLLQTSWRCLWQVCTLTKERCTKGCWRKAQSVQHRTTQTDTPCYIMWTSHRDDITDQWGSANHFVPLLHLHPTEEAAVMDNTTVAEGTLSAAFIEDDNLQISKTGEKRRKPIVDEINLYSLLWMISFPHVTFITFGPCDIHYLWTNASWLHYFDSFLVFSFYSTSSRTDAIQSSRNTFTYGARMQSFSSYVFHLCGKFHISILQLLYIIAFFCIYLCVFRLKRLMLQEGTCWCASWPSRDKYIRSIKPDSPWEALRYFVLNSRKTTLRLNADLSTHCKRIFEIV